MVVRKHIGRFAKLDVTHWVPAWLETRLFIPGVELKLGAAILLLSGVETTLLDFWGVDLEASGAGIGAELQAPSNG